MNKVIIAGASGQLGRSLILKGAKEGLAVVGTTRASSKTKLPETDALKIVRITDARLNDPKHWAESLDLVIEEGDRVLVINTIGGAHAEKGKSLEELNVTTPVALAKGVKMLENRLTSLHFVHLSSIAVPYEIGEYGKAKAQGEKEIIATGINNIKVVRVGYAVHPVKKEDGSRVAYVNNEHYWSPEQVASLPLQPILGSGKQPMQPVFIQDIVDGIFNAPNYQGIHIVDAVGKEVMSQSEFFKFFTDIADKKFNPLYLPLPMVEVIAEHFPLGHVAPYAVEYCKLQEENPKILCHKKFEELVGKPLTTLEEGYRLEEGDKVVFSDPPIKEHTAQIISRVAESPKKLGTLLNLVKHTPAVIKTNVKARLAN